MIKEAIVLAGGLGTRLRDVVSELPKCLAPVNGIPFLKFVIDYLITQENSRFVFALGYKHSLVEDFLESSYPGLDYLVSIESEPLGTGGAIQQALSHTREENVFVCNGDTLFKADLDKLADLHYQVRSACTLALKQMQNFSRYGVVELGEDMKITSFKEKAFYTEGLINGGMYILNKSKLLGKALPDKYSFEKDFLERFLDEGNFFGLPQSSYFIDIGIPEDFLRAQKELV